MRLEQRGRSGEEELDLCIGRGHWAEQRALPHPLLRPSPAGQGVVAMSGLILAPRTNASEIPAVIASSVNLMAFSNALAEAGIVWGRHGAERDVLAIEPAEARIAPLDVG